jgi:hypothetical protein
MHGPVLVVILFGVDKPPGTELVWPVAVLDLHGQKTFAEAVDRLQTVFHYPVQFLARTRQMQGRVIAQSFFIHWRTDSKSPWRRFEIALSRAMTRFLLATTPAACSATVSFSESVNGPSTVTAAGELSLVIFDPSGGDDGGDRGRPPFGA